PIGFPSLASVVRKCLFPFWRIGIRARPAESAEDFLAVYLFITKEFTLISMEFAHHWRLQDAGAFVVYPVYGPLLSLRIEPAQGRAKNGLAIANGLVAINVA